MSRQRKTFISDAYAERQARFAKLGVALVQRPLRKAIMGMLQTMLPRKGATVQDVEYARQIEVRMRRVVAQRITPPLTLYKLFA